MENQPDSTYSLAMHHGPMPDWENITARLSNHSELARALGPDDGPAAKQTLVPVPQKHYVGNDISFSPQPPVSFVVDGCCGIPLAKAFSEDFTGLEDKDTPAFRQPVGAKPSIRINWPGYSDYFRQININSVEKGKPTSLAGLAYMVAKEMQRFIADNAHTTGKDLKWQLNSATVNMNTLLLTGVVHVSKGSIQPFFAVVGGNF